MRCAPFSSKNPTRTKILRETCGCKHSVAARTVFNFRPASPYVGDSDVEPAFGISHSRLTIALAISGVVAFALLIAAVLLPAQPFEKADSSSLAAWRGETPLSIVGTPGAYKIHDSKSGTDRLVLYVRLKNNGNEPIWFSKVFGEGKNLPEFSERIATDDASEGPLTPIDLPSGRATCFGNLWLPNSACAEQTVWLEPKQISGSQFSGCDSEGKGSLEVKDFGIEYTVGLKGEQETRRQNGREPLVFRCEGVCDVQKGTCA